MKKSEQHLIRRTGWLRAAVLGANDGIVSTSALVLGVAASGTSADAVLISGIAALVAGAMSMAAGEYVSVSSQADTERADLEMERRHLAEDPAYELEELAEIYMQRGLDRPLAEQVARQLTARDALAAHARDELGLTEQLAARPVQAAAASAATFVSGAAVPLLAVVLTPQQWVMQGVVISSLLFLIVLGAMAAKAGGAPVLKSVVRVTFWGSLAMAVTSGIGAIFGVVV
ncbi:MAG TPA: VIT family protein [Pseudohongiella sp.]|nr:VIT family protein [Pseudohongiella sp.]